jgi:hypothetical protein
VPPYFLPLSSQDLTKKKVSDFLHAHSAYELIPESGKVVLLDLDLPIRQAFHALHEQVRSSMAGGPQVLAIYEVPLQVLL